MLKVIGAVLDVDQLLLVQAWAQVEMKQENYRAARKLFEVAIFPQAVHC